MLRDLPKIVSSAVGELGLLSLRPSENKAGRKAKRARRAKARSNRDRPIGATVKGDVLRAIYVRIALWLAKSGSTTCVPVVATDAEIAALLPHLVGAPAANRVGRSEQERRRALSQMAYDWKAVIGTGARCQVEDAAPAVTFHLAGSDGHRRFWFAVDLLSGASDGSRVIEPPVLGAEPPVSLAAVVDATKVYRSAYMEWAELLIAAARAGHPGARAAVTAIRAARGIAVAVVVFVTAGLLFLALPMPKLHAQVLDAIRAAVQRALGVVVKNETSDYSLPPRLRIGAAPLFADKDITVQRLSATALVFTHNRAAEVARELLTSHQHDDGPFEHIQWEWAIRTKDMPAPVFKRTENPQLRVEFGRPIDLADLISVGCFPTHDRSRLYRFGPPGSSPPPPSPMTAAERDARDRLIIGRPETYDQPTPGSPNSK